MAVGSACTRSQDIADFRKDNGHCHPQSLCSISTHCAARWACSTQANVAIDGSKFKAVNNRDSTHARKMERRMAQIEESVARYGTIRNFVREAVFRHWQTNLSPKTTANSVLASNHSRSGRFHSSAALFNTKIAA